MSTDKGNPIGIPSRIIDGEELGLGAQALILNYMQGKSDAVLAEGVWDVQNEGTKTLLTGLPALYQPIITKVAFIALTSGLDLLGGTFTIYDDDSLEDLFNSWYGGSVNWTELGSQYGGFATEGKYCIFEPVAAEAGRDSYRSAFQVLTGNLVASRTDVPAGPASLYYVVYGTRTPPII